MYRQLIRRRLLCALLLLGLLLLLAWFSLSTGEFGVSAWQLVSGRVNDHLLSIIVNLRLTRTLGAISAGAALGVSGCVLQNILRNPLASPFTLGVTQGAAFGATFAIIVLSAYWSSRYLVVMAAFSGSLLAVGGILLISIFVGSDTEAIILAGVGIGSFFNAGIMFLKYFANDIQVASAVFWTFGDLAKADWPNICGITVSLLAALIFFTRNAWNYNAFIWGRETAESLGVNSRFLTIATLLAASLVSAVATAFLGIIAFVGLIAPHIVRMAIGNDYRFLIPLSALSGALLLVAADLIARTLLKPVILPVGIITSFAGVPLFLYILAQARKRRDAQGRKSKLFL